MFKPEMIKNKKINKLLFLLKNTFKKALLYF